VFTVFVIPGKPAIPPKDRSASGWSWRDPESRNFKEAGYRLEFIRSKVEGRYDGDEGKQNI
jgi:hypothetical protein